MVLSGGGGYGAYEVGVVKAILGGRSPTTGHQPIEPAVITGTSVGAFNAAYLVSRLSAGAERAAADLEKVWRERIASGPGTCGNGVFRLRFDPLDYVRPGCYTASPMGPLRHAMEDVAYSATQLFERGLSAMQSTRRPLARLLGELYLGALIDAEPFHELIRDTVDFDAIAAASSALVVYATSWKTGQAVRFDNTELRNLTSRAVQASASIPGVFPPTDIDGELYVDGGLSINTPISPALKAGADVVHLVFVDPQVEDNPKRHPLSTLAEFYRITSILFAAQVRADLATVDDINHAVTLFDDPPAEFERDDVKALHRTVNRFRTRGEHGGAPYRCVDVFVYRPAPSRLRGLMGLLDFEGDYVDELIQAGVDDAIAHEATPETSGHIHLGDEFRSP